MKKIVHTVFAILATMLLPATAYADVSIMKVVEVGEPSVSVFSDGDSIRIRAIVKTNGVNMKKGRSLTVVLTFCGGDRRVELPELTFTGVERYRFDRRRAILNGEAWEPDGRKKIVVKGKALHGEYEYRTSIPYMQWVDGASLNAEYIYNSNCSDKIVGSRRLALNWENRPERMPVSHGGGMDRSGGYVAAGYEDMVYFIDPDVSLAAASSSAPEAANDARQAGGFATVFYFPGSQSGFNLGFAGNDLRLSDLIREMNSLDNAARKSISVVVTGYASPEGMYFDNEKLAQTRANNCIDYLKSFRVFDKAGFAMQWVAEDWAGVVDYLNGERPLFWQPALRIVENVGIFDGREKMLMDLDGGRPYRELMSYCFPLLRRAEIRIEYEAEAKSRGKERQAAVHYSGVLNLDDFMCDAARYEPSDDEYLKIYLAAAELYPHDVTVNNNLAALYLRRGDADKASVYLERTDDDPATYINKGVYHYMTGDIKKARIFFIKAVKANYRQAADNLLLLEKLE